MKFEWIEERGISGRYLLVITNAFEIMSRVD